MHRWEVDFPGSKLVDHELAVASAPQIRTGSEPQSERAPSHRRAYRLQANVRRGNGSNLSGAWLRYEALDDAREAARELLRDERVVRVTIVTDTVPPRFVEWVNR